jgi:hypothetical protein
MTEDILFRPSVLPEGNLFPAQGAGMGAAGVEYTAVKRTGNGGNFTLEDTAGL